VTLRLNDIWRSVSSEIGFYTKDTFETVPAAAGVYAWFYPLRITTTDPMAFIKEVNAIMNYDSLKTDKPTGDAMFEFAWDRLKLSVDREFKSPNLENLLLIWEEAVKSEPLFNHLRRCIMKASIFMPPLYVGKTANLRTRCYQHMYGNDRGNNFCRRYTEFAQKNNISARKVSDLLLACIRVSAVDDAEIGSAPTNFEGLIEEILKYLSKPIYSVR